MTTTQASGIKMPAEEAAGRLVIRELFDAYAHGADRRDARGQMPLFPASPEGHPGTPHVRGLAGFRVDDPPIGERPAHGR